MSKDKNSERIALIIPYFGHWPKYFNLYLASLKHQKMIDLHLFTNLPLEKLELPDNLFLHNISIKNFLHRLEATFGFSPRIDSVRKICDFKPAFGEVFQDIVSDYGFWAFGDIDLIYGNLDKNLSGVLGSRDIISFRDEWISGSLCILRNSDQINQLYRRSTRWREYFQLSEHVAFDENCGIWVKTAGKGPDELLRYDELQSFSQIVRERERSGHITVHRRKSICESISKGQFLIFLEGKLSKSCGDEITYYHFVTEKRKGGFYYPPWTEFPDQFFVDKYGFYQAESYRNKLTIFKFLTWTAMNFKADISNFFKRSSARAFTLLQRFLTRT